MDCEKRGEAKAERAGPENGVGVLDGCGGSGMACGSSAASTSAGKNMLGCQRLQSLHPFPRD